MHAFLHRSGGERGAKIYVERDSELTIYWKYIDMGLEILAISIETNLTDFASSCTMRRIRSVVSRLKVPSSHLAQTITGICSTKIDLLSF